MSITGMASHDSQDEVPTDASLSHRAGPHVPGVAPQHVFELLGANLVARPPETAGHRALGRRPGGVGQQRREDRHAVYDQLGRGGVAPFLPQPSDLLRGGQAAHHLAQG
eukprot:430037-Pyramimonas_sp.AAC.1